MAAAASDARSLVSESSSDGFEIGIVQFRVVGEHRHQALHDGNTVLGQQLDSDPFADALFTFDQRAEPIQDCAQRAELPQRRRALLLRLPTLKSCTKIGDWRSQVGELFVGDKLSGTGRGTCDTTRGLSA